MKTINPTGAGSTSAPTVTFWGAAQMVTGSMHLIEHANGKVLLDCGMYQGKREEARARNADFPFDPSSLDAVVISHAHIDHSGNVPTLVKQGYDGPIFVTAGTFDLLKVMLADSARIQEEDARMFNIQRKQEPPLAEPLYKAQDVERALSQCEIVGYGDERQLGKGVRARFDEAGHVLGSAMVHLTIESPDDDRGERTVTFTGDLGRRNIPLLRPSAPVPAADLLVCESTYGNRTHQPIEGTVEKLYGVINRTFERGGKVLIPAFSLGRCQLILHYIHQGILKGKIPARTVYVDSPLATKVMNVYRNHPECLTDEAQTEVASGESFLKSEHIELITSNEESMAVSRKSGSCVIIAASGMCDAGRIQQHLKAHIDDPRCTVALVSYQAPGTVGRKLTEPKPTVKIMGQEFNKWIDVEHLDGFSAHADRADFTAYLEPIAGKVGKVRLIHGEREQSEALKAMLQGMGYPDVAIPEAGERLVLD